MKVIAYPGLAKKVRYKIVRDMTKPKAGETVVSGGLSPDEAEKLLSDLRIVEKIQHS